MEGQFFNGMKPDETKAFTTISLSFYLVAVERSVRLVTGTTLLLTGNTITLTRCAILAGE